MKIYLKPARCAICNSNSDYRVIYKKNFKLADLNTTTFSARRLPDKIHYQIVKCKNCGLIRSTPVVDPKYLSQLYKKSALTYDDEINNLTDTYLKCIKPILNKLSKRARILEIGCGNGFVLKAIYDLGFKNVYGIEPSEQAIEKSDKKIRKNIVTDILKPNLFKKNSFDLIFFFQTLDHIPNPNQFLNECYQLLKTKGYILSFNHNVDSFSSKILGERSPIIDIEHTFLYGFKTMESIFKKNRFQVIDIYSPKNTVSLKHLFWLAPIPKLIKVNIIDSDFSFLNMNFQLELGNLCLIAKKI